MTKGYRCPKCGSGNVSRMYLGFYARVDPDTGEDLANFEHHESSTELSDDCSCADCGHGWEKDDD